LRCSLRATRQCTAAAFPTARVSLLAIKLMNRFVPLVVVPAACFIVGAMIAAYLVGSSEQQTEKDRLESFLSSNKSMIVSCASHCKEGEQELLVAENDKALLELRFLEETDRSNPLLRTISWIFGGLVHLTSTQRSDSISSTQVLEFYRQMGCGVSGVVCQAKDARNGSR
jgi:hypothetical protein